MESLDKEAQETRAKAVQFEKKFLVAAGFKDSNGLEIFDVEVDNSTKNFIHTIRIGDKSKEPLLLIHGYGGTGMSYYNMFNDLILQYNVFTIDLLGMGLSSRPKFEYETTEDAVNFFVDSIEEWRKQLGLDQFSLSGHSFGGYICLQYALKYQSKLKRLFLISPAGVTKPEHCISVQEWKDSAGFWDRQFIKIYEMFWENKWTIAGLCQRFSWISGLLIKYQIGQKDFYTKEQQELMYDYYRAVLDLPISSEKAIHLILTPSISSPVPLQDLIIEKLRIPMTFFYGDADWMDYTGALTVVKYFDSRLVNIVFIKNASHQITFDNPSELSAHLILECPS